MNKNLNKKFLFQKSLITWGKCLFMEKAGHRVAHKNDPIFHEKYLQNN